MGIDWKRKLSSRKFWVTVVGFVTSILFTFGTDAIVVERITGLIMAGSTLIIYILAEGYVDGNRDNDTYID